MRKIRGFTLLELLIVVAIMGILVMVAYPSYQNSVIKGNRASAKAFMMDVSQREAQYLLDKRSYVAATDHTQLQSNLGATVPNEVSRYYNVSVSIGAGNPPSYTIRAEPKSGTSQYKDGWIQLDSTGAKTSQYADKW